MTVGVDARTNSLVVSAPDNLFSEVKLLVEQLDTIDTGSNETMKVVTLKRSNPSAVQTAPTADRGRAVANNDTEFNGQPQ